MSSITAPMKVRLDSREHCRALSGQCPFVVPSHGGSVSAAQHQFSSLESLLSLPPCPVLVCQIELGVALPGVGFRI